MLAHAEPATPTHRHKAAISAVRQRLYSNLESFPRVRVDIEVEPGFGGAGTQEYSLECSDAFFVIAPNTHEISIGKGNATPPANTSARSLLP